MTRLLQDGRTGAASGTTRSLVVFLHGYGADGADLLGLAQPMAQALPDTAFRAPDAPERCLINPMGRQWFPIPTHDGSSQDAAARSMAASAADLDAYLTRVMEAEGVGPGQTAIVGFSQGTMMALHVVPRRDTAMAALVGFSGRLIRPDLLADQATAKPPIFLAHGDADEIVPSASMPEAEAALRGAGFDVETHVMRGTPHGIAPDGLARATEFLAPRLGAAR